MRRILIIGAALLALLSPAKAADSTVAAMSAAGALGGTELLYCVQGGADRKCTPAQLNTYVLSLMGTGVATALGVNVGSAGAPVLFNGAGGTPSSLTLTNATGLPLAAITGLGTGVGTALSNPINATNGFATYVLGSSSAFGLVKVDGTTITAASGVISAAPLKVTTSVQTGANYAFVTGDQAKVVYLNNGSNQIPTIAQAGTAGFAAEWFVQACNIGAGTQTLTPTTSTIGGAATFVFPAASDARPACAAIISDGTNYRVYPDFPMDASMFSAGTVAAARLPFGTGVGTAAAANLSAAGGLTTTIGSGTAALGTSAISSGACASVVTVATTNVATTDVISFTPNADIVAVTGYAPVTTGGLAIYPYPTSGNVNFKVCNPTASSITPGAVTLNFRVTR